MTNDAGAVDHVLPVVEIGPMLVGLVSSSRANQAEN
jgi:hypothetical protein